MGSFTRIINLHCKCEGFYGRAEIIQCQKYRFSVASNRLLRNITTVSKYNSYNLLLYFTLFSINLYMISERKMIRLFNLVKYLSQSFKR